MPNKICNSYDEIVKFLDEELNKIYGGDCNALKIAKRVSDDTVFLKSFNNSAN